MGINTVEREGVSYSHPANAGLITFKIKDIFISSWPTIAVNGYTAALFTIIPPKS